MFRKSQIKVVTIFALILFAICAQSIQAQIRFRPGIEFPHNDLRPQGSDQSTGQLAAVARYSEHLDVFWAGNNWEVGSNWWNVGLNNANWNQVFSLSNSTPARLGAILSVVSPLPERMEVYWIGEDGAVQMALFNGQWNPPVAITPGGTSRPGSSVVALARDAYHREVFWVNYNNDIEGTARDDSQNDGQWVAPFIVTQDIPRAASLSAIAPDGYHIEIYFADFQGRINLVKGDGTNGWQNPQAITVGHATHPGAPVSVVARTTAHRDVFWVEDNMSNFPSNQNGEGRIFGTWRNDFYRGGQWSAPYVVPNTGALHYARAYFYAGLSVIAPESELVEIYFGDDVGRINRVWWDGASGWHGPQEVTSFMQAAIYSPVTALARRFDHRDVFFITPDGRVENAWWHKGVSNDRWNPLIPISAPNTITY